MQPRSSWSDWLTTEKHAESVLWCADLVHVGIGTPRKMVWPHGRGRSGVRRKYKSHLTVRDSFPISPLSLTSLYQDLRLVLTW